MVAEGECGRKREAQGKKEKGKKASKEEKERKRGQPAHNDTCKRRIFLKQNF